MASKQTKSAKVAEEKKSTAEEEKKEATATKTTTKKAAGEESKRTKPRTMLPPARPLTHPTEESAESEPGQKEDREEPQSNDAPKQLVEKKSLRQGTRHCSKCEKPTSGKGIYSMLFCSDCLVCDICGTGLRRGQLNFISPRSTLCSPCFQTNYITKEKHNGVVKQLRATEAKMTTREHEFSDQLEASEETNNRLQTRLDESADDAEHWKNVARESKSESKGLEQLVDLVHTMTDRRNRIKRQEANEEESDEESEGKSEEESEGESEEESEGESEEESEGESEGENVNKSNDQQTSGESKSQQSGDKAAENVNGKKKAV